MIPSLLIGLGFALVCFALFATGRRKRASRAALLAAPFPDSWNALLQKRMECYDRLPPTVRETMQHFTQVLVAEKRWEACGGLPGVTEEMRVIVSAQAALLLAGRGLEDDFYPELKSILIYPGAFRDGGRRRFGLSEEEDEPDTGVRLGESWTTGSVILAWDSVLRGAADCDNGMNVTLHEFAHQLDQADGRGDGLPILKDSVAFHRWAEVMQAEYESLIDELNEHPHRRTTIDPYGATNPAEFFAVATEEFFEQPRQLNKEHPELYDELRSFYRLNPSEWRR